jgi:hypothetical protein
MKNTEDAVIVDATFSSNSARGRVILPSVHIGDQIFFLE